MGLDTSKYCKTGSLWKVFFNFWKDFLASWVRNAVELLEAGMTVPFFVGFKDLEPGTVLNIDVRDPAIALKFQINRL